MGNMGNSRRVARKHNYPKERSISKSRINLYLTIVESIKQNGKLPKSLISKSLLQFYVSRLKKQGIIKRLGFGTWEVDLNKYKLIQPPWVTTHHPPLVRGVSMRNEGVKSDDVRVHNLMFKLKVSSPLSWESRLKVRGVPFEKFRNMPGVIRVVYNSYKIWLCKEQVIVYVPPGVDYTASSVSNGLLLAVEGFLSFVPVLEASLGFNLRFGGSYVWSMSRKHLSLVKNALAQDYNNRKQKLRFFDDEGLWLIADDSYNLGELEFVRSSSNQSEAQIVQAFFNDLKLHPVKPSELLQVAEAQAFNMAQVGVKLKEIIDLMKKGAL